MEYFLGSLITVVVIILVNKYLSKNVVKPVRSIRYSQSNNFEMLLEFTVRLTEAPPIKARQTLKHFHEENKRILVLDDNAYWIDENTFYVADIINTEIDISSARQVDIMSMDKVQLDKMIYIVEKLTEGIQDDNWNSRQ
jgi:hypothetical protein